MSLPNEWFDIVLMLAGIVLVLTGLVMFIHSKTASAASSVEAFGIKLNVTHPSLILVLAGVGLMLAPRLLPEQPGKHEPAPTAETRPATPTVAQADAPTGSEPGTASSKPEIPSAPPAASDPTTQPPVSPPHSSPPMIKPVIPVPAPKAPPITKAPPIAKTPQVVKPKPAIAQPIVKAAPAVAPEAAAGPPAKPAIVEPPAAPPVAAKPARPILAFAAMGLPTSRSFWSGETRAGYTQRMHVILQQSGRDILRTDTRNLELGQKTFDTWWNESNAHPRSRELCAASPAPRALLSARVETPTTISSVESAFWPELKLRLFICANQRIYRQQKTLAPNNDDAWPFETELNAETERFLRTYRSDLAD
jgi:hypothetical protein